MRLRSRLKRSDNARVAKANPRSSSQRQSILLRAAVALPHSLMIKSAPALRSEPSAVSTAPCLSFNSTLKLVVLQGLSKKWKEKQVTHLCCEAQRCLHGAPELGLSNRPGPRQTLNLYMVEVRTRRPSSSSSRGPKARAGLSSEGAPEESTCSSTCSLR